MRLFQTLELHVADNSRIWTCLFPASCLRAFTRCASLCLFVAISVSAAEPVTNEPAVSTNLPLRTTETAFQPGPFVPELPPTRDLVGTVIPVLSLGDAQLGVIRTPEAWRAWAALAFAHHRVGNFHKAAAAVRQMRAAATSRNESLPLIAEELAVKCTRASEALTILD